MSLDANVRGILRDAIEEHLRRLPERTSKSRIKELRGLARPQYRLRVGDLRVLYDVQESTVQILAIGPKSLAHEWLERWGEES